MIKGSVFFVLAVTLTLFCDTFAIASQKQPAGDEATISFLQGTAQAFTKGKKAGRKLRQGDRIGKDQEIRVGAEGSKVEIRFPDGTVIRLSEKSHLAMSELQFDKKTESKTVKVDLGVGKLWANVRKLVTPDSTVQVRTVNAVAGVRGTVYRVNAEEDKSATIKVYDGSVYVANPPRDSSQQAGAVVPPHEVSGPREVPPPYHEVSLEEWTAIVKAMQQITVSPQGVPSQPQDFDAKADADDWVKWNQERDKQVPRQE